MASTSSRNHDGTKTRLQDAIIKGRAEDKLKEQEEWKRQKKMFSPRNVIEPRDILVESNISDIKKEKDVSCNSFIKQETLDAESTVKVEEMLDVEEFTVLEQLNEYYELTEQCKIQVEIGNSLVVKVEKTLNSEASSTIDHINEHILNETVAAIEPASEITPRTEDDNFLQNHLQLLQVRVNQKNDEINVLIKIISGLQFRLQSLENNTPNEEIQNELNDQYDAQVNTAGDFCTFNLEYRKIVAQLISDLTKKDAKIKMLNTKMIELQNELFEFLDNVSQIPENDQSTGKQVLESFEMVLPLIYPELQLNDILACRKVSQNWKTAVDTFLNTDISKLPFDKETHLLENHKLELGRIPTSNISPFKKLFEKYRFSDVDELDSFTNDMDGVIIGSTVCLDNILFLDTTKLNRFLATFGIRINNFEIRQCINAATFKIQLFMSHVKLCLSQLPNIRHFRLVFSTDENQIQRKHDWNLLINLGIKPYKSWHISTFPKLQKLESIVINNNCMDCSTYSSKFLHRFSNCLVEPYLKQLKQLSMCTYGYYDFEKINQLNLVQLTIPRIFSMDKRDFCLESVEKVTITSTLVLLMDIDILGFQRWFPNLVCLGFKCEIDGGKLAGFFSRPCFVELHNIVTLELENYDAVEFGVLRCFQELRNLKIISTQFKRTKYEDSEPILNITSLCHGENLYDIKSFWKTFPNISLVILEFNGTPQKTLGLKICTWTRQDYIQYLLKI